MQCKVSILNDLRVNKTNRCAPVLGVYVEFVLKNDCSPVYVCNVNDLSELFLRERSRKDEKKTKHVD